MSPIAHFDLQPSSGRLAVRQANFQGRVRLELWTAQGEIVSKIDNVFLPNAPRWSPDGSRIAFGSNDGLLYLYTIGTPLLTLSSDTHRCRPGSRNGHPGDARWRSPPGSMFRMLPRTSIFLTFGQD